MDNHGIKYFDLVDFVNDKENEVDYNFMGSDGTIPLASISMDFYTALNEYKKSFMNRNTLPYVKLIISTSRKINKCDKIAEAIDIFDLKRITSSCAAKRIIYLSPNCDEVYGERYDIFSHGYGEPRKFWFDYRVLYADGINEYESVILPKNGELVSTKFIRNDKMKGYCHFPACSDRFFNFDLMNGKGKLFDNGKDVYYGFTTRTNIKCNETGNIDYCYFDNFDNFVPAATLERFVIEN